MLERPLCKIMIQTRVDADDFLDASFVEFVVNAVQHCIHITM